jgi:hypothetical protein
MATSLERKEAWMRIKRIMYSLASLAALALAVGASWRPN